MADQLSGVAIIICIAFGVLTFLLLFIFANRQIKRFSLKSRSGPHVPTATDSSKVMQNEIDRRFDVIKVIFYQPKLLRKETESQFLESERPDVSPLHLYRMRALDSISLLESGITTSDPTLGQLFSKDVRLCLIRLYQKGQLRQIEVSIIHRFADLYEFARHEPGEFNIDSYVQFMELIAQVQDSISPRNGRFQSTYGRHLSPVSNEMRKHFSNGKLSSISNEAVPTKSEEGESSDEKKITYETSV